jgi:hypothetical protein
VAAGDQGFEIFDLTNPGNPTSLSLTTPQAAGSAGLYIQGLDLAEGYLFVTDYSGSRMLAYKVSDAVRPQAMGAFLTSQGKPALWVRVQGQHVYLSSEERGLEVIEVFE